MLFLRSLDLHRLSEVDLSLLWVVFFASAVMCGEYRSHDTLLKKDSVRVSRQCYDGDQLRKLLGKFPSWVEFPITERCHWLNHFVEQLWIYAKPATEQTLRDSLNPIFKQYQPAFLSKLGFRTLDMGYTPPAITGVNVIHSADEV